MVARYLVAIVAVGLAGAWAGALRTQQPAAGTVPALAQLPRELSVWQGEDFPLSEGEARALGADATLHRLYRRGDGAEAWLFVAYFAQQQVNSQIHSPRHCLPGGGCSVTSFDERDVWLDGVAQRTTHMGIVTDELARQDVFYWFETQGGTLTGEYALKWDLVKSALARKPTHAAFVRYNASRADSTALHELMGLMRSPLERVLGEAGL